MYSEGVKTMTTWLPEEIEMFSILCKQLEH